ncbi:MAG: hypothetical protein H6741_22125 [Alphaproteobacteria bacterium]|nr:hypothetical protein [Alphaproteobacteria bacterium]
MLFLLLLACGAKPDSPAADDSALAQDDSASDDTGADDSATDDSASDDSATDDSATDDSATDDSAAPTDEDCDNGRDDDLDGLTDCEDADCVEDRACQEVCGNRDDDDLDGLTDCEDEDCWTHLNCISQIEAVFTTGWRSTEQSSLSRRSEALWYGTVQSATPSSSWVQNVGATWTHSWHGRSWAGSWRRGSVFEGALVLQTPGGQQTCSFDRLERHQRSSGFERSTYGQVIAASGLTWDSSYASWFSSSAYVAVWEASGATPCDGLLRGELADAFDRWFPTMSPLGSTGSSSVGGSTWTSSVVRGRLHLQGVLSSAHSSTSFAASSTMAGPHTLSWRP